MSLRLEVKDVQISVSFWFFAVSAFFLAHESGALFFYFLLPAAAHELGHILSIILCGVKIRSLSITAFGADIKKDGGLTSYAKEIFISASGVLANALFALGLYFFAFHSMRVMLLAAANVAVAIFNLLPIGSLDGGNIVRLFSERFFSPEAAFNISRIFSLLTLVPLFALSFFLLLRPERNFTLLLASVYLTVGIIAGNNL